MSALTDFSDLYAVAGLDEVSRQVDGESPVTKPPQWPEPTLPGTMPTPAISTDVLATWARDMVEAVAAGTQTPPALGVMVCLSVLATVFQGRYEVEPLPGYREPLSLWGIGTAPPGARKTAVMNALSAPFMRWEKLQADRLRPAIAKVNAQRAVAKKRIERLQQDAAKAKDASEREAITTEIQREEVEMPKEARAPRVFTNDCTSERLQALLVEYGGRMAVLSDEGGIFMNLAGLYNGGNANNDVYLKSHAGSSIRVDRADRCAHIDKPALSFGLLLQLGVLSEAGNNRRFRDTGLLARFLYFMPISNVGQRDVRSNKPVPLAMRDEYERHLIELMDGLQESDSAPKVLTMTDPARECWLDLAEEIEQHQGDGGKYESISDWTSKLPGATARIAALLELAEVGLLAEEVSHSAMDRATRLARLLIPHAQAAFGLLGTDATDTDATAILKWIRANDKSDVSRRELQKGQEGRFRSVERLKKALERLEAQDVVREYKRHNKGAPPTTAYRVNPKALST